MKTSMTLRHVMVAAVLLSGACSGDEDETPAGTNNDMMSNTAAGTGPSGGTGAADDMSDNNMVAGNAGNAGGDAPAQPNDDPSMPDGNAGDGTEPPPQVEETLDPDIDWEALSLVFPRMYSAYDGVHVFQVPARVDGVDVELSDWQAIPSSAAAFDPDPDSEGGGVLITVLEPEAEITIAVSSNGIGGTAPLYVTEATADDWAVGEARYNNGVEYDLPMVDLINLLDPTYTPPETPTNLACNNCHTSGAKYLEVQHTPSQAAYISDEDLTVILTEGTKPDGITYSVLPPELAFLYAEFHTWEASEAEIKGLIVYLRSLTPESQGEIVIPDNVTIPTM